jgi:hypothetical protein
MKKRFSQNLNGIDGNTRFLLEHVERKVKKIQSELLHRANFYKAK